jgi:hypothetical protein
LTASDKITAAVIVVSVAFTSAMSNSVSSGDGVFENLMLLPRHCRH